MTKVCAACAMETRYLRKTRYGTSTLYEYAGDVLVLRGNVVVQLRSWLPHKCPGRKPRNPIEHAAQVATDPVARAAFAAMAAEKK